MAQAIYAIKDKALGFYHVFMASNDYGAQRYCNDLTVQENTFYNKHANDLDLYKLTELNTDTGDTQKDLKFICNLEIFKEKAEQKIQ